MMKKLRLDLDTLAVESFHPEAPAAGGGTVHGEAGWNTAWQSCGHPATCGPSMCGAVHTCAWSCHYITCGPCTGAELQGGAQAAFVTAGGPTACGGVQTCGQGCAPNAFATAGGVTVCGGIQTCGQGCAPNAFVTAGGYTVCGGIHTCGPGCWPTAGGPTVCGGIYTCGQGCPR